MYKITSKINEVDGFKPYEKKIFICKKNSELYVNHKFIINEIEATSLTVKDKLLLFISDNNYITYFYDSHSNLKQINYVSWLNTFFNDSIIIYNYEDNLFTISLYNLIDNNIISVKEKVDLWNQIRSENNLFFYNSSKTCFRSLSLLTGEYEWELDLRGRYYYSHSGERKGASIGHILGVCGDKLLLTLGFNFVCIEIHTGSIIWETTDFVEHFLEGIPVYKQGRPFQYVHLEDGKLYNLTGSIYYSFDIATQKFKILWQDKKKEGFLNIKHSTFTTEYVYFTASYNQNISPTVLGVFNRKTLEMEWLDEPTLSVDPKLGYLASLNKAPQIGANKLYVLDSGGTLHIFEKEEEEVI